MSDRSIVKLDKTDSLCLYFVLLFKYDRWAWPSAARPGVQKDALTEFVTGSLFIHNIQPLIRAFMWEKGLHVVGTKLRGQPVPSTRGMRTVLC